MAQTSNYRVIMTCELYCCLLPQCEALRICCSGFPIAKFCAYATRASDRAFRSQPSSTHHRALQVTYARVKRAISPSLLFQHHPSLPWLLHHRFQVHYDYWTTPTTMQYVTHCCVIGSDASNFCWIPCLCFAFILSSSPSPRRYTRTHVLCRSECYSPWTSPAAFSYAECIRCFCVSVIFISFANIGLLQTHLPYRFRSSHYHQLSPGRFRQVMLFFQLLPLNVFASSLCVFLFLFQFFSTLCLRAFIFPLMSVHHTQFLLSQSSSKQPSHFQRIFLQSTALHITTNNSFLWHFGSIFCGQWHRCSCNVGCVSWHFLNFFLIYVLSLKTSLCIFLASLAAITLQYGILTQLSCKESTVTLLRSLQYGSKFGLWPLFAYQDQSRGRVLVQLYLGNVVFLDPPSLEEYQMHRVQHFNIQGRIYTYANYTLQFSSEPM